MIISRTPFRISFFGGGTDYPRWYEEHGGAVLATTIDKYCYVTARHLPPFFKYKYRIRYSKREETKSISKIKHPSVRECLLFSECDKGIEMQHNADLPARSGLGSSSSFTVGFLNSLYALQGKMVTKRQLALDAIHVEQDKIKENVGSQDQTMSAFGGFNRVAFDSKYKIIVEPVVMRPEKVKLLQDSLMLLFTGFSRNASDIAAEQIRKIPKRKKELKTMHGFVDEAVKTLGSESDNIDEFGRLLHENWKVKRGLTSSITTPAIDDIYDRGRRAGAIGGKLLGAGSGGFMLFYVKPEQQAKFKEAMKKVLMVPFNFEMLGSQIVYYKPNHNF